MFSEYAVSMQYQFVFLLSAIACFPKMHKQNDCVHIVCMTALLSERNIVLAHFPAKKYSWRKIKKE